MTVGEVLAASAPPPEEKIQPCPKDAAPVPPLLMAKVVVACTTPLVAKSVPLKVPMPKVVVVALVKSALLATSEDENRFVEVELVVVEFLAVKSWKVEDPVTKRLVTMVRPTLLMEKSVVVAFPAEEEAMTKAVDAGRAA